MFEATCAANASCISIRSMSASFRPARSRALRDGEGGAHEELAARVHGRDRPRAHEGERLVALGPRLLLRHEQHRGGAVGQRRRVARGHRAVLAVEHRGQRGQGLEGGVAAHQVVGVDRRLVARRHGTAHSLGGEPAVGDGRGRALVATPARSGPAPRGVMPFSFAIFSADSPMREAGRGLGDGGRVSGTRSRGRTPANARRRGAKALRPRRLDEGPRHAPAVQDGHVRQALRPSRDARVARGPAIAARPPRSPRWRTRRRGSRCARGRRAAGPRPARPRGPGSGPSRRGSPGP